MIFAGKGNRFIIQTYNDGLCSIMNEDFSIEKQYLPLHNNFLFYSLFFISYEESY